MKLNIFIAFNEIGLFRRSVLQFDIDLKTLIDPKATIYLFLGRFYVDS